MTIKFSVITSKLKIKIMLKKKQGRQISGCQQNPL